MLDPLLGRKHSFSSYSFILAGPLAIKSAVYVSCCYNQSFLYWFQKLYLWNTGLGLKNKRHPVFRDDRKGEQIYSYFESSPSNCKDSITWFSFAPTAHNTSQHSKQRRTWALIICTLNCKRPAWTVPWESFLKQQPLWAGAAEAFVRIQQHFGTCKSALIMCKQ